MHNWTLFIIYMVIIFAVASVMSFVFVKAEKIIIQKVTTSFQSIKNNIKAKWGKML